MGRFIVLLPAMFVILCAASQDEPPSDDSSSDMSVVGSPWLVENEMERAASSAASSSSEIPGRCNVCFESEPQVTYFNHACCPNLICTDCARQMEACPFGRHSWDGTQQNQRVMRMTGLFS